MKQPTMARRTGLHSLVLIVALVAIWQLLYGWVGDVALASPLATLRYTATLFASESFASHVLDTLRAFGIAYALSVVMGLLVGFWLGFDRLSGDTLEPMIVSLYAIPKLTLYPILLLAFGLGLSAKVAFGVLHGVIPIILFTLSAVHNTKPILMKTGRVRNLSQKGRAPINSSMPGRKIATSARIAPHAPLGGAFSNAPI